MAYFVFKCLYASCHQGDPFIPVTKVEGTT